MRAAHASVCDSSPTRSLKNTARRRRASLALPFGLPVPLDAPINVEDANANTPDVSREWPADGAKLYFTSTDRAGAPIVGLRIIVNILQPGVDRAESVSGESRSVTSLFN